MTTKTESPNPTTHRGKTASVLLVLIVALVLTSACTKAPESAEDAAIAETEAELNSPADVSDESESEAPVSGVHIDALDRDTRPQDDFYQFANGGWLDSTEIPEIYSGYTVYHQVYEDAEEALKVIIEEAAANPGAPGTESQKVGDIFTSWMDEQSINERGIAAVQPELVLVDGISDVDSLVRTIAELDRRGIQTPYGISLFPDLKNSSEYAVYFNQSGITLPDRDYYLDTENENFSAARAALPDYAQAMLQQAGVAEETAAKQAQAIYALEEKIAQAHWDKVRNRDPELAYNPYATDDLSTLGSNLNWQATREIIGLESVDKLIIQQPSYFENLDQLLAEVPINDWKAYLTFRVMDSRGMHLDSETAEIRFDFRNRTLYGQQTQRPRWKLGISIVNSLLGEAVGKLYVAEYFPPEAKAKMEVLVQNVIDTLDESLHQIDWMSAETREKALEKLSKFTPKIGYPDEWKDYSDLEIVAGDHIGNLRRTIEWNHQQELLKLERPVDRKEWFMTPQTVNAYYDPTKNEIVFPAARLQPPFVQLNADDAINYGAVGGVIGHEISHGFDDSGSKFDGDGNLVNWWTEADREAFEKKTNVLVEQYGSYEPIPGMFVNGELTLGENIGDVSGVAMAYRAYIRSLDGEEAPVIDGFTGPQRFFIGYAMSRKGKQKDESAINQLASDPHSPLKYRVNGVYRNLDAFHEAFNTQEGDGMWLSPEDRVSIW